MGQTSGVLLRPSLDVSPIHRQWNSPSLHKPKCVFIEKNIKLTFNFWGTTSQSRENRTDLNFKCRQIKQNVESRKTCEM